MKRTKKKKVRITKSGNLELRNETHYSNSDLKRLIRAAMETSGVWKDGTDCICSIGYIQRRGATYVTGYGYYPAAFRPRRFRIRLPWETEESRFRDSARKELSPEVIRRAAQVAIHEIDHTLGLHHKDMLPCQKIETPWADHLRIRIG